VLLVSPHVGNASLKGLTQTRVEHGLGLIKLLGPDANPACVEVRVGPPTHVLDHRFIAALTDGFDDLSDLTGLFAG
jgi:hypothetical protein